MRLGELFRALFRPVGPRRIEADKTAVALTVARRANRASVLNNKRAVQQLMNDTIGRLERQDENLSPHR